MGTHHLQNDIRRLQRPTATMAVRVQGQRLGSRREATQTEWNLATPRYQTDNRQVQAFFFDALPLETRMHYAQLTRRSSPRAPDSIC